MGYWNIEGLNINSDDSKMSDNDLQKIIKQHDIFTLGETHIGEHHILAVEGYGCVKICHSLNKSINRYFGGIAVFYKLELRQGIKFLEHRNNDFIWVQLKREFFGLDEDLFVCFVYIPP